MQSNVNNAFCEAGSTQTHEITYTSPIRRAEAQMTKCIFIAEIKNEKEKVLVIKTLDKLSKKIRLYGRIEK